MALWRGLKISTNGMQIYQKLVYIRRHSINPVWTKGAIQKIRNTSEVDGCNLFSWCSVTKKSGYVDLNTNALRDTTLKTVTLKGTFLIPLANYQAVCRDHKTNVEPFCRLTLGRCNIEWFIRIYAKTVKMAFRAKEIKLVGEANYGVQQKCYALHCFDWTIR